MADFKKWGVLALAFCAIAQAQNTAKWPAAIPTDKDLLVAKDSAYGSLAAGISSSDTTITLATGTGARFPAADFVIVIELEKILVQSRSGDTLSVYATGGRGFLSTTPAAHDANVPVYAPNTEWHHNQTAAEVKSLASELGVNLGNVMRSSGGFDTTASSSSSTSKWIFRAPNIANDTSNTVAAIAGGTDGTLGPLNFVVGLRPSATGGSRWGWIALTDSGAVRPLSLNGNGSGSYGNVWIGRASDDGSGARLQVSGGINASGTISAATLSATSSDNGTTAISRVYASNDSQVRYYSLANFAKQVLATPVRRAMFSFGDGTNTILAPAIRMTVLRATASGMTSVNVKNLSCYVDAGSLTLALYTAASGGSQIGSNLSVGTSWSALGAVDVNTTAEVTFTLASVSSAKMLFCALEYVQNY